MESILGLNIGCMLENTDIMRKKILSCGELAQDQEEHYSDNFVSDPDTYRGVAIWGRRRGWPSNFSTLSRIGDRKS